MTNMSLDKSLRFGPHRCFKTKRRASEVLINLIIRHNPNPQHFIYEMFRQNKGDVLTLEICACATQYKEYLPMNTTISGTKVCSHSSTN